MNALGEKAVVIMRGRPFAHLHRIGDHDRLLDTLRSASDQDAAGMLDAVQSSVMAFMDSLPPSDDMTLLVARRL